MESCVVGKQVVKRFAVRSTRASAKLERRVVPDAFVRSAKVKRFLAARQAAVLMPVEPEYGETPVSDDEIDALLPNVRALLGEPVTKAAVYDLDRASRSRSPRIC